MSFKSGGSGLSNVSFGSFRLLGLEAGERRLGTLRPFSSVLYCPLLFFSSRLFSIHRYYLAESMSTVHEMEGYEVILRCLALAPTNHVMRAYCILTGATADDPRWFESFCRRTQMCRRRKVPPLEAPLERSSHSFSEMLL